MKHTICGFSQSEALKMRRTEIRRDKEVSVCIDAVDLMILRWFVDFYPRMNKKIIDGKEYAWLKHSELESDMPILGINARSCGARMKKLVSFGILEYRFIKKDGTWSFYTFGEEYGRLVSKDVQTSDGARSNAQGVCGQTYTPVYVQTDNKDPSAIGSSTRPKEKREKKPAKQRYGEYDNVLLTDDDLSKLKAEFPNDWQSRIERLSEYMASSGKTYKNHLATIRSWARRNNELPQQKQSPDPHRQGKYSTDNVNARAFERIREKLEKAEREREQAGRETC